MTNNQQSELEKKRRLLLDLSYHLRNNYGTIDEILAPAMDILDRFLLTQRQQLISEIEGIVGEDEKIELEQPELFQPNPEPNEYGGYSSVPFYCSLCGESEMTIQDNEVNGKYHCKCSWWTNSCGGKWIKWYDKDYAEKAILDIPSEDNIRNQLRKEIRERLKLC